MDEEKGDKTRSVVGRLLTEISWEGKKVRQYREGGQGFENVLTAEVLQALNFLPRKAFMGCVLDSLPGKVPHAAKTLAYGKAVHSNDERANRRWERLSRVLGPGE